MKKNLLPLFLLFSVLLSYPTYAQIKQDGKLFFKLKHLQANEWGVFVIPDSTMKPSNKTMAGAGQVTLLAPAGFTYYDFKNVGGTWVENAKVINPIEVKNRTYISFGFVTDSPKINLSPSSEQLLFSFKTDDIYYGTFSLFENGKDPFDTPNSWGTNPGNDLGMIDRTDDNTLLYYTYSANIIEPFNKKQNALLVSKHDIEID